jgi:hypothetical protein
MGHSLQMLLSTYVHVMEEAAPKEKPDLAVVA